VFLCVRVYLLVFFCLHMYIFYIYMPRVWVLGFWFGFGLLCLAFLCAVWGVAPSFVPGWRAFSSVAL
jgi:hypothetical protein